MATGKRYYWIKLKESFMTSDTVDFLMSQKDGANYVVLYQMLCLKTINTGGRLARQIGEIIIPYDVEKIQRDCKWFTADTIRVALELFAKFGLVYQDEDGTLVMADHNGLVGSETDYAVKNRRIRANKPKPLLESGHRVSSDVSDRVSEPVSESVTTDIRDKRLEIRDKRLDTRVSNAVGAELFDKSSCPEAKPAVFTLPLNNGTQHEVTQDDIDGYSELYPAVDVPQEIRKMIGWLDANPKKRKTKRGVKNFINGWLSREQDRGGKSKQQLPRGQPPPPVYADEEDFY